MKKLLIIILVLISVQSFGQFTKFYTYNEYLGAWGDSVTNIANRDTAVNPYKIGETRFRIADSTVYIAISTSADNKWMKLRGYVPSGIGTGTVQSVGASIDGSVISVSGSPVTGTGTLAFNWNGAASDVVFGNGSYSPFSTSVTGITDPLYSPIGHSHVTSDITGLTTYVWNLFHAGSGLVYDNTTGTFSYPGDSAGINSLNGLTDAIQYLDIDTTYTGPAGWSSVGTTHTLRLPARLFDGSGGGGNPNSNIGSGYRFAVPGTNDIKTLFNGYAIGIDSTSNTNALTLKADTSLLLTKLMAAATYQPAGSYLTSAPRFGVSGEDDAAAQSRSIGFSNTYNLTFGSVNNFIVSRGGVNRILMNNLSSGIFSPDGNQSVQASDVVAQLNAGSGANTFKTYSDSSSTLKRISYTSNLHGSFTDYSLIDKSYLDSVAATLGGSGTVNSGTQYRIGIYPTTGTAISEGNAITSNRALISDANGVPTHSTVTNTELGYVSGVTSSIQTQINGKQDKLQNVYYLSINGCVSDADLSFGSSTFGTDNTTSIQNILNLASPTNPILVYVDGRYSVTGLQVKGNTSIIGTNPSNGFILRNSSDKPLIRNYNKSYNPAARVDSNILIENIILNGNGGGQTAAVGNSTYGLFSTIQMMGVYSLKINNCLLQDARSYATDAHNNKYYWITNCHLKNSSYGNNDGLHADGNSENVVFENNFIEGGNDDKIAINADDNYIYATGHATYPYYIGSEGPVSNVYIHNNTFEGGYNGVRILSDSSRIDNVVVDGLYGATTDKWLETDKAGMPGAGDIGRLDFRNIDVKVSHSGVAYEANIATKIETLNFKNINRTNFDLDSIPTIVFNTGADIGTVTIDGYTATDTTTNSTNHFLFSGGVVKTLSLSNSTARKTQLTDSSNLILIDGGTINRLRLNNVEVDSMENVVRFINGSLPYISASGITHFAADSSRTFYAESGKTVTDLVLSNYFGYQPTDGTFTKVRGDGFLDLPNRPVDPGSSLSDLVFTHFVNGPLDNASGVWTSGGTVDNAYNHKGANDLAFSAGGNGILQMYADASADGCRLGFNADGAWPTTPYIYIGVEFLSGNVIAHNGLSGTSTVEAISTGYYYRIIKTGDSFVLKKSATENGTYTTIYTYSSTWSSTMWPMCDIAGNSSLYKLYYPKQTGAE